MIVVHGLSPWDGGSDVSSSGVVGCMATGFAEPLQLGLGIPKVSFPSRAVVGHVSHEDRLAPWSVLHVCTAQPEFEVLFVECSVSKIWIFVGCFLPYGGSH